MGKIVSNFAIVDVKAGRAQITKALGGYPNAYRASGNIPVTINGFITHQWGHDDGVSREFAISVSDLKVKLPRSKKVRS